MQQKLQRTFKMSSYNLVYQELIVAGADTYFSADPSIYVIEMVPYVDQMNRAGLRLIEEDKWDDYFDSEEEGNDLTIEQRIYHLLGTMLFDFVALKDHIELRKRKDVHDLSLAKNGRDISLIMVNEFEPFVSGGEFRPGLFVYDTEEFDIWQFPNEADDEQVWRTVYPALKSLTLRKP